MGDGEPMAGLLWKAIGELELEKQKKIVSVCKSYYQGCMQDLPPRLSLTRKVKLRAGEDGSVVKEVAPHRDKCEGQSSNPQNLCKCLMGVEI